MSAALEYSEAAGTADEKLMVAVFEDQVTEEILNPEVAVHPVVGYEIRAPLAVHVAEVDAPGVGRVVQVSVGPPPVVMSVRADVFVPEPVNPVEITVESLHVTVELVNVYPLAYGATLKEAIIVTALFW